MQRFTILKRFFLTSVPSKFPIDDEVLTSRSNLLKSEKEKISLDSHVIPETSTSELITVKVPNVVEGGHTEMVFALESKTLILEKINEILEETKNIKQNTKDLKDGGAKIVTAAYESTHREPPKILDINSLKKNYDFSHNFSPPHSTANLQEDLLKKLHFEKEFAKSYSDFLDKKESKLLSAKDKSFKEFCKIRSNADRSALLYSKTLVGKFHNFPTTNPKLYICFSLFCGIGSFGTSGEYLVNGHQFISQATEEHIFFDPKNHNETVKLIEEKSKEYK